jgi:hypothetical protein
LILQCRPSWWQLLPLHLPHLPCFNDVQRLWPLDNLLRSRVDCQELEVFGRKWLMVFELMQHGHDVMHLKSGH